MPRRISRDLRGLADELQQRLLRTLVPEMLRAELRASEAQVAQIIGLGVEKCADLLLLKEEDLVADCRIPKLHARRGLPPLHEAATRSAAGRASQQQSVRGNLDQPLTGPSDVDMHTSTHPSIATVLQVAFACFICGCARVITM